MKNKNCASFHSGVGGMNIAFINAGFKFTYAKETDQYAAKLFQNNFQDILLDQSKADTNPKHIPKFQILLSRLQNTSTVTTLQSFMNLKNVITIHKPKVLFFESMKNLTSIDQGTTFQTILETLEKTGYYTKYQVLNSLNYGDVPHNCERMYIVAFRNKRKYQQFEFPKPISRTKGLQDVLGFTTKVEDYYYYTDQCSFYPKLIQSITQMDRVYQWKRTYVRENKSFVCPTLTTSIGTGGHNVPLIKTNYGIRKLIPEECYALQGFPDDYKFPSKIARMQLYKMAGKEVNVTVVERIARNIYNTL